MANESDDGQPLLCVLTDRSLTTHITAFVSGVPFFAYQLWQRLQRVPGRRYLGWSHNVTLWQDAVLTNDRQTLDALRVLFEHGQLREALRDPLYGLLGFAVAHTSDVALLDWIYDSFPDTKCRYINYTHIQSLVKRGDLDVVKWTYQRQGSYVEWITGGIEAAALGHLAIIAFLHERASTLFTSAATDSAAANGHLEVIRFLHENRAAGCTERAMDSAAANGHLEVVRFLHENRNEGCTKDAMDEAAANGYLEVVRFLHENRTEGCTKRAMVGAASSGHLEVLTFLHQHIGYWGLADAIEAAVRHGHIACVRYLPLDTVRREALVTLAATHGRLECIQYFHECGDYPLSSKTLHQAAIAGHLHVVRFLYEHRAEHCSIKTLLECDKRELHDVIAFACSHTTVENRDKALVRAIRLGRQRLVVALSRPDELS